MMGKEIIIEIQYFEDCPNSEKAFRLLNEFISKNSYEIRLKETLVETQEAAEKNKFRGSPTILVNGYDLEGLEEPKNPNLSCRFYQNGFPTITDLDKAVKKILIPKVN